MADLTKKICQLGLVVLNMQSLGVFQDRQLHSIIFKVLKRGLGISLIGGKSEEDDLNSQPGIFVRSLLDGGLAAVDGRLQEGDQIVDVNGDSFLSITNERAVTLLRKASADGHVEMKICRDSKAREDYITLLNTYCYSSASSSCIDPELSPSGSDAGLNSRANVQTSKTNNISPAFNRSSDYAPSGGSSLKLSDDEIPKTYQLPRQDNLSIDPNVRLKIEKLETSLKFLGLEPTLEQQAEMRHQLQVDRDGTVTYGEFVQLARKMFTTQLVDIETNPRRFKNREKIKTFTHANQAAEQSEILKLKSLLHQKDLALLTTEDELLRVRREAQNAIAECRALKTRLHLAEEAQKAARSAEEDYETVLRVMEKEIGQPRNENELPTNPLEIPKQHELLKYQLRQAEVNKKIHEVANERLLLFAELVSKSLSNRKKISSGMDASVNRNERHSPLQSQLSDDDLATEANKTIAAVKSLFEIESLPAGWDAVNTPDGLKYFVNYNDQTISWTHPLSKTNHHNSRTPHVHSGLNHIPHHPGDKGGNVFR